MSQDLSTSEPRYSRRRGIDPSIFKEVQKPAPKVHDLAETYRREAESAVARILRREGISADYKVQSSGKRVIVVLAGVAQELIYHLSALIANAIRGIQQDLFGTGRFSWHHTVQINGRQLTHSG